MNILRGSRVKRSSKRANDFISSIGFDGPLTRHVVMINIAHTLSLIRSGEIERSVGASSIEFLMKLPAEGLQLDESTEDVHHMIEQQAIKELGMETAGYLNLGKSRNDQVATALRMETRYRMLLLVDALTSLQKAVLRVVRTHGKLLMPGYTHLQHAQPVTVGHHFLSYFDALQRSIERIEQAYVRINLSPMGAAALAGTSIRVDRGYVASLLGFGGLVKNSMDAVSSRDFGLESLSCAALVMVDLSRMAEELILWSSKEFSFIEIADEFSATSSIMPQKKNPVVAETIRAKCGSVAGELTSALCITKALPNSYNLDLQELTPHLWRGLDDALNSVKMMEGMLSSVRFREEGLAASLKDDRSTATELANHLVRKYKVPFREAHAIVGELVTISLERGLTLEEAASTAMPEVSNRITGRGEVKIDMLELGSVLDVLKTLGAIRSTGGASPKETSKQLVEDSTTIKSNALWMKNVRDSLGRASQRLQRESASITQIEVRR